MNDPCLSIVCRYCQQLYVETYEKQDSPEKQKQYASILVQDPRERASMPYVRPRVITVPLQYVYVEDVKRSFISTTSTELIARRSKESVEKPLNLNR